MSTRQCFVIISVLLGGCVALPHERPLAADNPASPRSAPDATRPLRFSAVAHAPVVVPATDTSGMGAMPGMPAAPKNNAAPAMGNMPGMQMGGKRTTPATRAPSKRAAPKKGSTSGMGNMPGMQMPAKSGGPKGDK